MPDSSPSAEAQPLRFVRLADGAALAAADAFGGRSADAGRLARLGHWMAKHRGSILALQWIIVVFYLVLVALPAFLPHPNPEARLFSADMGAASFVETAADLTGDPATAPVRHEQPPRLAAWHERLVLLAQYLFWGVWWPFVILSIVLLGRVWCGVLCPEGALSEFASRHGRGGPIPRWLRWAGWPFVAFVLTTVYGQLISVYEYPQAALLILGGSTVAALAVGWMYGKGKRVWCRYLCPVTGVFALLARLSPLHFRVDKSAWAAHPERPPAVDCAPLLNVKTLDGMAQCHACGRCSGHRSAVQLAARRPGSEIIDGETPHTYEALLLLFGIFGVAGGAFSWTISPWFVQLKQATAEWLIDRDLLWPLTDSPAWWLLTRYPELNDVFSWLDGAAILVWIAGSALLLGGISLLAVAGAARLLGLDWRRLALGLVPLAGASLFLGLSMMTATHLRAEGFSLDALPALRAILLAAAVIWSAWLGWQLMRTAFQVPHRKMPTPLPASRAGTATKTLAFTLWLLPLALISGHWGLIFFVW